MASTLNVTTSTLIAKGTPSPTTVTSPAQLRTAKLPFGQSLARDIEGLAQNVANLHTLLANTAPSVSAITVNGKSVADALADFIGDTGSGGQSGLVPAPRPGDAAASKYLKANGKFEKVVGGALIDTHANRSRYPAYNYAGGLFFESDRSAAYFSYGSAWIYLTGLSAGVDAAKPTDLGIHDRGFRYEATDTALDYRWSGYVWKLLTGPKTFFGTHAARATYTGPYPVGSVYFESDRTATYAWTGLSWHFIGGGGVGPVANRPNDLAVADSGFQWFDTNLNQLYFWTGSSWSQVATAPVWGGSTWGGGLAWDGGGSLWG